MTASAGSAGVLTPESSWRGSVVVVVLNYKNWSDTIECLASVADSTLQNRRVVVVDNGSGNGSVEKISEWMTQQSIPFESVSESGVASFVPRGPTVAVLVTASVNRGYAAGNNLGLRLALRLGAQSCVVVNSDVVVVKGCLERLSEFARNVPNCGVVGPMVLDETGRIDRNCARRRPSRGFFLLGGGLLGRLVPGFVRRRITVSYKDYDFSCPRRVDIVSGCCLLITSACLRQVGLLDEGTFLFFEELILHERMRPSLFVAYVEPAASVVHKVGRSRKTVSPRMVFEAFLESQRYYLVQCRHFGRVFAFLARLNASAEWRLARFAAVLADHWRL